METEQSFPGYEFGVLKPDDFAEIKQIHEELLPIRYAERFYEEACLGFGLRKAPLFSQVARNADGNIVGFILAQFINASECEDPELIVTKDDKSVFDSQYDVMYILTLGCKDECRRKGLASYMVQRCINYATLHENCGAVYLHVIHNNDKAIAFYEKNAFVCYRTLSSFYIIDQTAHKAHLYIHYMPHYAGHPSGYGNSSVRYYIQEAMQLTEMALYSVWNNTIVNWFGEKISAIYDKIVYADSSIAIDNGNGSSDVRSKGSPAGAAAGGDTNGNSSSQLGRAISPIEEGIEDESEV